MVVHPFGDKGHLRHFAERGDEIFALETFVQFAIHQSPTLHGLQVLLNVRITQSFGAHEKYLRPQGHGGPIMRWLARSGKKEKRNKRKETPVIACLEEIQYAC
jgi:hypothetical protein